MANIERKPLCERLLQSVAEIELLRNQLETLELDPLAKDTSLFDFVLDLAGVPPDNTIEAQVGADGLYPPGVFCRDLYDETWQDYEKEPKEFTASLFSEGLAHVADYRRSEPPTATPSPQPALEDRVIALEKQVRWLKQRLLPPEEWAEKEKRYADLVEQLQTMDPETNPRSYALILRQSQQLEDELGL